MRGAKGKAAGLAAIGGIAGLALNAADNMSGANLDAEMDSTLTYIKGGKDKKKAEDGADAKPQDAKLTIEEVKPLSVTAIESAIKHINEYDSESFKPLSEDETKHLTEGVKTTKLPLETLIALRHTVISQRIANKIAEVIEKAAELEADHKSGKTILEIANARKLPPLAVARQLLLSSGKNLKESRAILNGEEKAGGDLDKQIKEAAAMDHASKESMNAISEANSALTKKVKAMLDKAKAKYLTADDLAEEQTKDPDLGRPIATPDFAFKEPITINGKLVYWLDAKNHPLLTAALAPKLAKSMAYLASKYTKHFGHGAFIFTGVLPEVALETKKGPVDVDILVL